MDKAPGPVEEESIRVISGEPLTAEQIAAVYARLPEVPGFENDTKEFSLRSTSMPAPRAGDTVQASFPPPDERSGAPSMEEEGPLEVLRFQPEGEIPRPRRVSVTFSHPMVAVTSHDDAIEQNLPVRLTPEPPGNWRWVGTKTLVFESDEDFPMATEYTLSVLEGAKSAVGSALSKPFRETFSTQPVKVERVHPSGGPVELDPVIVLLFDQRVDAEQMSESVQLRVGRRTRAHRLATPAEVEASDVATMLTAEREDQTWIAIKPGDDLPTASTVQVVVKKGAPSAEGPRRTTEDQSHSFRTYGAFEMDEARCGGWGECRPNTSFFFHFTNPIDPDVKLADHISVSPEIPDMVLSFSHRNITIQGRTQAKTKYKVHISNELRDRYGQQLKRAVRETFNVGEYPASLTANGESMVILDPYGARSFSVYSVNYRKLAVKVYRVTPSAWSAYAEYHQLNAYRHKDMPTPSFGTKVLDTTITVGGKSGELVETPIDLSKALGSNGLGHAVVEVVAQDPVGGDSNRHYIPRINRWIQSTQIGVDAYRSPDGLTVWATTLKEGKPLAGAEVEVASVSKKERTGKDGLAELAWTGQAGNYLVVRREGDEAILPERLYLHRGQGWSAPHAEDWVSWFVVDDRQLYKPGEDVRLKGWARVLEASPRGGIKGIGGAQALNYRVVEPRGNEITSGQIPINNFGGFDLKFSLPDDANLGTARVEFTLSGGVSQGRTHRHSFQIQEFRRPEYEVKAEADPGPHVAGEKGEARVEAAYYSGGALPEADVTWSITRTTGHYKPPNWPEFVFGSYRPWWWHHGPSDETSHESRAGKTDFSGEHRIELQFAHGDEPKPQSISAVATVMDVNRQAWSATANMLVHPARHYVGMRTERWFYEKGKPIEVDLIATGIEGEALTGRPIVVTAHRLRWVQKGNQWTEEEIDGQECRVKSASEPVRCSFKTPDGGRYRVKATIEDLQGRKNQTEVSIWVSGGKQPPK
ncbi:MAG: MG2 domain-containing protein, partial [Bradymonadaceae bacterium]